MSDFETGVNNILGGTVRPRIRADLEQYAQRKGMPEKLAIMYGGKLD